MFRLKDFNWYHWDLAVLYGLMAACVAVKSLAGFGAIWSPLQPITHSLNNAPLVVGIGVDVAAYVFLFLCAMSMVFGNGFRPPMPSLEQDGK